MKRKAASQTLDVLRFSISNLPLGTRYQVTALDAQQSIDTSDYCNYVIHFKPPMDHAAASRTRVSVSYCGEKIQENTNLFTTLVSPPGTEPIHYSLKPGHLEYQLFETHVLRVYGTQIGSMYLSFENVLCNQFMDTHASIQLQVDMGLSFLPRHISGAFLRWFPPDVDPIMWGLVIDPSLIPQRSPLWFKLRGIVSGSKAYQLLGFWADRAGTPFGIHARAAMRLGSISEPYVFMAYLSVYPGRSFQEVGWCKAPRDRYPEGWGASPDGIFLDPTMTWDQVPEATREAYCTLCDITRGAAEFKVSRTKTQMEAYFIPQVYMEMIALNVVWCDLVRFKHSRYKNDHWIYEDQACVYRIYRDPELEKDLVALWKYALAHDNCVIEKPFVDMRQRLETMAESMEPVKQIDTSDETISALYRAYDAHEASLRVTQCETEQDYLWSDANERHQKIMRLDQSANRAQMIQLLAEQIQVYSGIIQHL
jgi:hypothetical protein